MPESDHYDVVIIGTGAGGGTLAWKLAPSGRRILLLERGPYLPREQDNWNSDAVFVHAKYHCTEEWLDRGWERVQPRAELLRRRQYQVLRCRPLPPPSGGLRGDPSPWRALPAWPLSYEDFEPFYAEAERLYHVHGPGRRGPDRRATQRRLPVPGGEA